MSYNKEIFKNFRDNGVITIDNILDDENLVSIKKILKEQFKNLEKIEADGLNESGILDLLLTKKIRYLINLFIPDGILWHCEYLKTPCNQKKPHFDPGTNYGSWHRDRVTDYNHNRIDFLDIMIYLNDVDKDGGGFGFLPIRPDNSDEVDQANKSSKIIGNAGLGILSRIDWWHTATPNSGNQDREMIRLSISKNMYYQTIHESEEYTNLRNEFKDNDEFLFFLFGGNRKWYKNVQQPNQKEIKNINFEIPPLNYTFSKSYKYILKNKLKNILK